MTSILKNYSQSNLEVDGLPFSKEVLQNKTLMVLKQFCKECGLTTSGSHKSLVERIMEFQKRFYKTEEKSIPLFSSLSKSERDTAIKLLINNYLPREKSQVSTRNGITLEGKDKKLIWVDRNDLSDNQIYDIHTAQTKTSIEWLSDSNIKDLTIEKSLQAFNVVIKVNGEKCRATLADIFVENRKRKSPQPDPPIQKKMKRESICGKEYNEEDEESCDCDLCISCEMISIQTGDKKSSPYKRTEIVKRMVTMHNWTEKEIEELKTMFCMDKEIIN